MMTKIAKIKIRKIANRKMIAMIETVQDAVGTIGTMTIAIRGIRIIAVAKSGIIATRVIVAINVDGIRIRMIEVGVVVKIAAIVVVIVVVIAMAISAEDAAVFGRGKEDATMRFF